MKYKSSSLKDLISFISKGIVPKYANSYDENVIRVINQRCNRNGEITFKEARYSDLSKRKVTNEKLLKNKDILINSTGKGTAGRVAQISENQLTEPTTVDGHMIIIRPSEKIDPDYLGYALKAQQRVIESYAEGSTGQTEINKQRLLDETIIKYPSKEEQRKIANIFINLDMKIKNNQKINTNLFGLSETIFNNILEEETIKLSEITTIQNGYAFKSSEYIQDEQLMVLRTKNIGINNLFSKDDVVYISKENLEKYSKFSFKQFDTVIVMVGASIGRTGFLTSNIVPSLQNQNMWRFRPLNSKMPGLILYQYINYINTRVKNSASGSARSFYTKKIFNEFDVPRINTAYYKTFSKLQEQIDNLSKETEELKKIKSILLNEYF